MQEDAMPRGTNTQKVHHLLLHQESMCVDDHPIARTTGVLGCAREH
jgi:hypothetical protein